MGSHYDHDKCLLGRRLRDHDHHAYGWQLLCAVLSVHVLFARFLPSNRTLFASSPTHLPTRADVLVYFSSEDDRSTAYFPKVVVVVGLTMVCLSVLMLPLDVANRPSGDYEGGGFDMELLWNLLYGTQGVMAILIIPATLFYYEAEDPESREYQCWTAIKYEAVTVFFITSLWIILWVLCGTAEVLPHSHIEAPMPARRTPRQRVEPPPPPTFAIACATTPSAPSESPRQLRQLPSSSTPPHTGADSRVPRQCEPRARLVRGGLPRSALLLQFGDGPRVP